MKGHVPTPANLVDMMVKKLFEKRKPGPDDRVLEVGCGDGPFIAGILRYCDSRALSLPRIMGIELNPTLAKKARKRFSAAPSVEILHKDYLAADLLSFDFIVGNPPYVRIEGLDASEKRRYRNRFLTAVGRFDLYLLFFEQSLRNLAPNGRLVLVTPEKFEYVDTAAPLRKLIASHRVTELIHLAEDSFPELVTYPTITVLDKTVATQKIETRISFRNGENRTARIPEDGQSWAPILSGHKGSREWSLTLADVCLRVSCGIATGTDKVFVIPGGGLEQERLQRFCYPTISGRQLGGRTHTDDRRILRTTDVMLVPYDAAGRLLAEDQLGSLGDYLREVGRRTQLESRRHVAEGGRAWYRFHDSAPLQEILLPKLICKDITPEPHFWIDEGGVIIPRHSAYYVVPRPDVAVEALAVHLNSASSKSWIMSHAQRAANGFYRVQANVLKRLPVPPSLAAPSYPNAPKQGRGIPVLPPIALVGPRPR